jgi:hypothetical protein
MIIVQIATALAIGAYVVLSKDAQPKRPDAIPRESFQHPADHLDRDGCRELAAIHDYILLTWISGALIAHTDCLNWRSRRCGDLRNPTFVDEGTPTCALDPQEGGEII